MRIGSGRAPKLALVGISTLALGMMLPFVSGLVSGNHETSDGIRLKGTVDMVLYDEFGKVKDERHFDNLIVDTGIEAVASRIAPHDGSINPTSPFNYIAIGTGNTPVTATDTSLSGAELARVQDSEAAYSATEAGKKLILSVTFLPGQGTGTVNESGVFNAASGGEMLSRQTFTEIQKAAGDTLTVTWTYTLTVS